MAIRIEQQPEHAVGQIGEGPDPLEGMHTAGDRQFDPGAGADMIGRVGVPRWPDRHLAFSASANVAPNCTLPKRSTHTTSVCRDRRPSASVVWATLGRASRTRDQGQWPRPSSPIGPPRAQCAGRWGERSRPSNVRAAPGAAASCDSVGNRPDTDEFRRRDQEPVVRADEVGGRRPGARHLEADTPTARPHTGIDHRQHDAGTQVGHRPHQGKCPPAQSNGGI